MGIIWFGKEEFPTKAMLLEKYEGIEISRYSITFAMRLYGQARGKGIAKPYMRQAIELYPNSQDYQNVGGGGIWLETSAENTPAVCTNKDLFDQISKPDDSGLILMVYRIPTGSVESQE